MLKRTLVTACLLLIILKADAQDLPAPVKADHNSTFSHHVERPTLIFPKLRSGLGPVLDSSMELMKVPICVFSIMVTINHQSEIEVLSLSAGTPESIRSGLRRYLIKENFYEVLAEAKKKNWKNKTIVLPVFLFNETYDSQFNFEFLRQLTESQLNSAYAKSKNIGYLENAVVLSPITIVLGKLIH